MEETIIQTKPFKVLICTNKLCKHEWNYKGSSPFYVTCPRCYRKVNVVKAEKLII